MVNKYSTHAHDPETCQQWKTISTHAFSQAISMHNHFQPVTSYWSNVATGNKTNCRWFGLCGKELVGGNSDIWYRVIDLCCDDFVALRQPACKAPSWGLQRVTQTKQPFYSSLEIVPRLLWFQFQQLSSATVPTQLWWTTVRTSRRGVILGHFWWWQTNSVPSPPPPLLLPPSPKLPHHSKTWSPRLAHLNPQINKCTIISKGSLSVMQMSTF